MEFAGGFKTLLIPHLSPRQIGDCRRSCCGLLHVRKLPGLGAFARPAPEAPLLLLRHRRTRLAIEELQIDPDAEAAEAAASGARAPSAGLCGGGPLGAASALDF